MHDNPIIQFAQWFALAEDQELKDANAMILASADAKGIPSARVVLLKDYSADGFIFYTNMESRKAQEVMQNPHAAATFYWKSIDRQIRIEGPVSTVDDATADAYFATRPRESQIGAWVSDQSRPLESRVHFMKAIAKVTAGFGLGEIPRPPHWSGFCLKPERMEFWSAHAFRWHERYVYSKSDSGWSRKMLYP